MWFSKKKKRTYLQYKIWVTLQQTNNFFKDGLGIRSPSKVNLKFFGSEVSWEDFPHWNTDVNILCIVDPPDLRGPWFVWTRIYIISESFHVNMSSCSSMETNPNKSCSTNISIYYSNGPGENKTFFFYIRFIDELELYPIEKLPHPPLHIKKSM